MASLVSYLSQRCRALGSDNPFLRLEWRRWVRRGIWRAALPIALLLATTLAVCGALVHESGLVGERGLGMELLGVAGLLLLLLTSVLAVFPLLREAHQGRLQSLLLVRLDPGDLLARLGAAQFLGRTGLLLVLLPVAAVPLALGGAGWSDLARVALVVLLVAAVGPVGTIVEKALRTPASSAPPSGRRRRSDAAADWSQLAVLLAADLAALGLLLLVKTPAPWLQHVFDPIGAAATPVIEAARGGLGPQLLFGYWIVGLRLLGMPLRFFESWAPLWPFLVLAYVLYWREQRRGAAEAWRTGLPSAEGKAEPWWDASWDSVRAGRVRAWCRLGLAAVGIWAALGFVWRPWIASGVLGALIGRASAGGGLLVWVVVVVALRAWLLSFPTMAAPPETRRPVYLVASLVGVPLIGAAATALMFRVDLPAEAGVFLGRTCLLAGAAAVVTCGARRAQPSRPPSPEQRVSGSGCLGWVLAVSLPVLGALGLLPAVRADGVAPAGHWIAAASPLYGFSSLLSGAWAERPVVPLFACVGIPTGLAAALVILSRWTQQEPDAQEARQERRLDAWERCVIERLAAMDSPLLLRWAERRRHASLGWLAGTVRGLLVILVPCGLLLWPAVGMLAQAHGASLIQTLGSMRDWVGFSVPWRLITAMVLLAGAVGGAAVLDEVRNTQAAGRRREQLWELLQTPISDREVVVGIAVPAFLAWVPVATVISVLTLLCAGWACVEEQHLLPLFLVAAGLFAAELQRLHLTLRGFTLWRQELNPLDLVLPFGLSLWAILPNMAGVGGGLPAIAAAALPGLLVALLMLMVVLAVTLPRRFRDAVEEVRRYRAAGR
jgi:hypothetical protein